MTEITAIVTGPVAACHRRRAAGPGGWPPLVGEVLAGIVDGDPESFRSV